MHGIKLGISPHCLISYDYRPKTATVFREEALSKEYRQARVPHKGGTGKMSRCSPCSWRRQRTFPAEKIKEKWVVNEVGFIF